MAAKNFELIEVLQKPTKETVYHKFVKKHIAAKLIIIVNLLENTISYEVRWQTARLRGKSSFNKIKEAIEYYNVL